MVTPSRTTAPTSSGSLARTSSPSAGARYLRTDLVDVVERGLGGDAEPREPRVGGHLPQRRRARLGAQAVAARLGPAGRDADEAREPVVDPADRVEVLGEGVARDRLDHQPGPVRRERL